MASILTPGMIDFKGHRFETDLILTGVRWYLAYPLSYRNLEEMMAERGVAVDHSNITPVQFSKKGLLPPHNPLKKIPSLE